MRAVVTIVVSRADMNRQNHSPEIMIFSLAGPILGTLEAAATGLSGGSKPCCHSDNACKVKESIQGCLRSQKMSRDVKRLQECPLTCSQLYA